MESYEFTLELSRDIIDSEAETIKSGCGDATIKFIPTGIDTGYTGTLVEFAREAESLEKAIESAMHDIEIAPDLHATGITIPAPERDESSAAAEPSGTESRESAGTESRADAEPGANTEKTEAKPAGKKATARKPSTRKSSTRKSAGSKESANGQENGAAGGRDSVDSASTN